MQNADLFPRATFFIHPKELAYSRSPRKGDWATASYFAATLQGQTVREVVEGSELEPGVRAIETPGHAPGHIGVVVDTRAWPWWQAMPSPTRARCAAAGPV